ALVSAGYMAVHPHLSAPLEESPSLSSFFFFNDTATTEIYTLSLHDALPIFPVAVGRPRRGASRSGSIWDRVRVGRCVLFLTMPRSRRPPGSHEGRFVGPWAESIKQTSASVQTRASLILVILIEIVLAMHRAKALSQRRPEYGVGINGAPVGMKESWVSRMQMLNSPWRTMLTILAGQRPIEVMHTRPSGGIRWKVFCKTLVMGCGFCFAGRRS